MKIPLLLKIYLYISQISSWKGFWSYFGWFVGAGMLIIGLIKFNPSRLLLGAIMILFGFFSYWIDNAFIKLEKLLEEDRNKFYEAIEKINKRKI